MNVCVLAFTVIWIVSARPAVIVGIESYCSVTSEDNNNYQKSVCDWQELFTLNWEQQMCIMGCIVSDAESLSNTAQQQWMNNLNSDIGTSANNGHL